MRTGPGVVVAGIGVVVAASLSSCGEEPKQSSTSNRDFDPASQVELNDLPKPEGLFSYPGMYHPIPVDLGIKAGTRILTPNSEEDLAYLQNRFGLKFLRLYSEADYSSRYIKVGLGVISVINVPDTPTELDYVRLFGRAGVDLNHRLFEVSKDAAINLQSSACGRLIAKEVWMFDSLGTGLLVMKSGSYEVKRTLYFLEFSSPGLMASEPDSMRQVEWARVLETLPAIISEYTKCADVTPKSNRY